MKNEILRKKASELIAQTLMKSMVRELQEDEKITIKNAKTIHKHFTSKKTKKLSASQLQNFTNIIVQKAFKNELKFISYKLHKTYIETPNDYDRIKKLEYNVNITLDLMQKQKVEIESYKVEEQKKSQKVLKTRQKRGYEIIDNIETEDLKATCIVLILEYSQKYNNEIVNHKNFIPYHLYNKLTYKIQYLIQKVKSYNNTKIFLNDSSKIEYLIDKKSFEIYQSPIGETLQKAKQIEKRKDNAIDYILQTLTKQQFEIYQLKLSGYSFLDIAQKLDKSKSTIKTLYYRVVSYMQKDKKLANIMNSVIA